MALLEIIMHQAFVEKLIGAFLIIWGVRAFVILMIVAGLFVAWRHHYRE
ncbi:hypothetical protein ACLJJ6_10565 [Pediococcus siamensis]